MGESYKERSQKDKTMDKARKTIANSYEDQNRIYKIRNDVALCEQLGVDKMRSNRIVQFYRKTKNVEIGSVSKCVWLLTTVLRKFNLSDEEVRDYINKNPAVFLNNYDELLLRIKVYNRCNCLQEVLFKRASLLGMDSELSNYNARNLVVYAKSKDYEIDIDELYSKVLAGSFSIANVKTLKK